MTDKPKPDETNGRPDGASARRRLIGGPDDPDWSEDSFAQGRGDRPGYPENGGKPGDKSRR